MELENLDAIVAQADAAAAEHDPQAIAQAEAQAVEAANAPNYGAEAEQAVDLFAAMVVGYAPKAETVWTDAAKARTAKALAPVLEKYGVSMGNLPPELGLIIIAGPLLWNSSKIVAAQMQADAKPAKTIAANAPFERDPAPETGQTPGPEVHSQVKLFANGGGV